MSDGLSADAVPDEIRRWVATKSLDELRVYRAGIPDNVVRYHSQRLIIDQEIVRRMPVELPGWKRLQLWQVIVGL